MPEVYSRCVVFSISQDTIYDTRIFRPMHTHICIHTQGVLATCMQQVAVQAHHKYLFMLMAAKQDICLRFLVSNQV